MERNEYLANLALATRPRAETQWAEPSRRMYRKVYCPRPAPGPIGRIFAWLWSWA